MLLLCSVAHTATDPQIPVLSPASKRGFEEPADAKRHPTEKLITRYLARWESRHTQLLTYPSTDTAVAMTYTASSEQRFNGKLFQAANAFDHNYKTAWVEDESGPGGGAWVSMEGPAPSPMHGDARLLGVLLVSGFAKNQPMFRRNPRPQLLFVELRCDGSGESSQALSASYRLSVADTRRPQLFVFGPTHRRALLGRCAFRATLERTYAGSQFRDASISEIRLVLEHAGSTG